MNATIYKCFIASPSDTTLERDCCDEVFSEINKTLGDSLSARIETVRWENDAHPALGDRGQGIINNQLKPEECDFFIAILKNKFGTPTSSEPSGTVEEFNRAYENFKRNKNPKILVYFYDGIVERNQISTEDIEKIEDFKNRIQGLGLYSTFKDNEAFKQKLRHDITQILNNEKKDNEQNAIFDNVSKILDKRLDDALSIFHDFKIQWIERHLCKSNLITDNFLESYDNAISSKEIIHLKESCIIKSPPQFGLTCLAHSLISSAWKDVKEAWIYLNFDDIKIKNISSAIETELQIFNRNTPDCIVLDSWSQEKDGFQKILECLQKLFPDTRLVIMQTEIAHLQIFAKTQVRLDRNFECYNLLSLPKKDLRVAVEHCSTRNIYDEDVALNRLTLNMEALNIHRTPMNCWTLLKVAETSCDNTPVNRTHMLELLLFALFSMNEVPTYTNRPDLHDCEHVLGFFCSKLLKNVTTGDVCFSQLEFFNDIDVFCKQQLMEIDIDILWNNLILNRIIIQVTNKNFRFKSTFWIYFFAAKRMEHDEEFKRFILSEGRYAQYPEIIEFYTGTSRDKTDVLSILLADIEKTHSDMCKKIGLPETNFNPLRLLKWSPQDKDLENMKSQLSDAVSKTQIPQHIKDLHADESYDHLKPYKQDIELFIENSSFLIFVSQLSALSRALRNSDYSTPEIRKKVISKIIFYWTEISKVIFVFSPLLAKQGSVIIEGYGFKLDKAFYDERYKDKDKLLLKIVEVNPENVVDLVKYDLSSERIGPLIYDYLKNNPSALAQLLSMLYLISERPNNWQEYVKNYIGNADKNSYYLGKVFDRLRYYYKMGYVNSKDESIIKSLLKQCIEKQTDRKIKTSEELKRFLPDLSK